MNKIISIMLIMLMTFGLMACGDASFNTSSNDVTDEGSTLEEINESLLEEVISSEKSNVDEQETVSTSPESNVLVVYFSVTGNTKGIAEKIAAVTDADIYEIKPAEEYTDADIDYGDSNSRTSKEQNNSSVRPEIQSETISLEGYDTIYIGYPIWWGEEPRIMDTFVENYNFGDITMIPFCTSGSSGIGNSSKNLAENADGGNWLEGKRFDAQVSESEIGDWISGLQ